VDILMTPRDFVLAGAGWCCLVAFVVTTLTGSGKTAVDYAQRSLQLLPADLMVRYDDQAHAMWSGWSTPGAGFRLTNAGDPDVIFISSGARHGCSIELAAFPMPGATAQTVSAALNRGPFGERVAVAGEGRFRLMKVGDIVPGVNQLSLRLANARKANAMDEHVLALGVRFIAFACERP
jgi:hypothetical protein